MAKKIYDEEINEKTDWGGDESTGGAPVSGRRIQEFIKGQLAESKSKSDKLESDIQKIQDSLAGSDYTATINVSTPIYNTVSYGTTGHYIDFTFQINHKSGMPTGEAVICTYTFKRGSSTQTITEQYVGGKGVHFNIDKYLLEGVNTITISIKGVDSKASVATNITFQVVNLSISCDYDISKVYDLSEESQELSLEFTVSGTGTKIVEWYLDSELLPSNAEIDEITTTSATRTKSITLSNLSEGIHSIQARAKTIIDGEAFYSHVEYVEFIVYNHVAATPRVAISMTIPAEIGIISKRTLYSMQQYVPYYLKFATYNPKSSTSEVVITLGGEFQGALNSENNVPTGIKLLPTKDGESQIKFVIGGISDIFDTHIQPSDIAVEEITDSLQLDFSTKGKSNNSTDKDSWFFNDYEGTFEGFYWNNNTSGWVDNALLINAGASFEINYAPLSINPSEKGKTIEIEFSSTNVNNDDAVLLDLLDEEGVGLLITATNVKLVSRGGKVIETSYKDNEMVRMAFVINKASGTNNKRLSFIYINGVLSRAIDWLSTDDYISPKTLRFTGTEGAEISLKALRIYDKALSSDEILNNYTLYRDSASEMIDVYERNNVYIEGSESFDYEKMLSRLPVMIVTGNVPFLEETNNRDDQITVNIDYFNFQDPSRSFRMVNAAMRPQGTSSMGYPKKNFRIYTEELENTILYDANNQVVENKLYSFKKKAQPVNCWCLKADYAESSGTHNTGIARLWNKVLVNTKIGDGYPLRTEAQRCALKNDYPCDVRTTIDGFPILMFYRLDEDSPLVFIGKYNFNNDKSTESVFGFRDIPGFKNDNMQCWEILNNGNSISLFTDISNFYELVTVGGKTQEGWKFAFESRYPDTKTPETTYLYDFCKWMTTVPENSFSTQKWDHLDVYKVAAYYVYLMRFGAVDQTVKNAMLTSEDGDHFYFINYDNDTINGLINTGHLVAPWNIDRTTLTADGEPYYAGRDSRLWNLLESDENFMAIVKIVDNALYSAGLRYGDVIKMFDDKQADKWVERVYNRDSQYKYIGPYNEKGVNNLFMLQGSRSEHRKYWLARRFAYYDSLFVSGAYKSQSIELKCLNNTEVGQKFKITAGTDMDYGYGINNITYASNISLHQDEEHEFETPKEAELYRGDPINIYTAPNIKALDLSSMTDRLAAVKIDGVFDSLLGTKFKKFILGSPITENTEVLNISGLANAKRLEHLDVRNMKGLTALDLSEQLYLKTLIATGSNIALITFAKGAPVTKLELPATMRNLTLSQLPYLSIDNLILEDISNVSSISILDCSKLTNNFDFIYNWYTNKLTDDSKSSLIMNNINWTGVDADKLIEIGNIGTLSLKGKIVLTDITKEQLDMLGAIFGESAFDPDSDFYIDAPPAIFITGRTTILEGESEQYNVIVFGAEVKSIFWAIPSGKNEYVSIDINTGILNTIEWGSDTTITLRATIETDKGYSIKEIEVFIKAREYPTATNTSIIGKPLIGEEYQTYSLSYPDTVTGELTLEWSLTGFDEYAEIYSSEGTSCTIRKLEKMVIQSVEGTISCNVIKNLSGEVLFTVSKTLSVVNPDIAETDPGICKALYDAGLSSHENYILKEEAAIITADRLYPDPTTNTSIFYKQLTRIQSFNGFQYFTRMNSISKNLFKSCLFLKSIILPTSIKAIEADAFMGCTELVDIVIPHGVTTIGSQAFNVCQSLRSVTIPDSVTTIEHNAFRSCKSLTSITIPDSVTTIGESAFEGCTSLTSVTIGNSVTEIGYGAFSACYSMQNLYITNLSAWCRINFMDDMSVPFYQTGNGKLYLNGNLSEELIIPSDITEIKPYTFYNFKILSNVIIHDKVTSIGIKAFYGCRTLSSISLPSSVLSIGSQCFRYCPALKSITCLHEIAPFVESDVFGYSSDVSDSYTGRDTYNTGENTLFVPVGATGYDTGAWLDPLCNAEKCGFTLSPTL